MKNKRILVTGGNGFLGKEVVNQIKHENIVFNPSSKEFNLTNENDVIKMYEKFKNLDYVIHIAADVGGIGYSSTNSAKQFYNNTLMNLYVQHYAFKYKVKKFIGIGSVCEYPSNTPVPFEEKNIWNGYPVLTNDAYGLTKRMLLAQSVIYKRDYGFNSIHLLLVNLYGPGDKFSEKVSHVIPAMIKKIHHSIKENKKNVFVWGTGEESREFLYVSDAAKAIILAAENYNSDKPINIGTGSEIKIKKLCNLIADEMNYKGEFIFEKNKLGGQKRRMLNVEKAKLEFNFTSETNLKKGIKNTIEYFHKEIIQYDN